VARSANGIKIDYIEPGKPNRNASMERFNHGLRNELLGLYLYRNLQQVRELTRRWRKQYDEHRPHDAPAGVPPAVYARRLLESLVLNCLLDGYSCESTTAG
jgi:putative transposase